MLQMEPGNMKYAPLPPTVLRPLKQEEGAGNQHALVSCGFCSRQWETPWGRVLPSSGSSPLETAGQRLLPSLFAVSHHLLQSTLSVQRAGPLLSGFAGKSVTSKPAVGKQSMKRTVIPMSLLWNTVPVC